MTPLAFRIALRSVLRRPSFSVAVALTLALGIGANVAMFTLVRAVVLRPLPYREPDRLFWVWHSWGGNARGPFSIPDLVEYRSRSQTLEGLAAFRLWSAGLTGQGEPERLTGLRASEDFFELTGVTAQLGRVFTPRDSVPRLALLGDGLWRRRFGADPRVIGTALTLNGEPYEVVGVLPRDFVFPLQEAQFAVPLAIDLDPYRNQPSVNGLRLLGRLRPGSNDVQAKADLERTTAFLRELHPEENAGKLGVHLIPLHEAIVGEHRGGLLLLWAAVGLVLVLACANLANLHLARAMERKREFALRRMLGGSRLRLAGQLLVESSILAALGGVIGIVVARVAVRAVLPLVPLDIPRAHLAEIDQPAILVALALSVAAGALLGALPAIQASRSDEHEALQGHRASSGPGRSRTRTRLLAVQTGLGLVLLLGAGLFLKSYARLSAVAPGFDPSHLLTVRVSLPPRGYSDPGSLGRFYRQVAENVATLPGVTAAGAVSVLPLSGYRSTANFAVVGQPAPPPDARPRANFRIVTPGYFDAMRIPIDDGRGFSDFDRWGTEPVCLVSRTLARRYWPSGGAVGSVLTLDDGEAAQGLRVVGIAGDVRQDGLDQPADNDVYIPLEQVTQIDVPVVANNMYLTIRSAVEPVTIRDPVRRGIAAVDRDVAASEMRTMEEVLGHAVAPERFNLTLLGGFAAAGLLLALLGVYGVTHQAALQRSHEMGIRLALGARPIEVVRLVALDGLRPALAGVLVGVIVGLALGHLARGLLFGVTPFDGGTFLVASATFIMVTALASTVPAVRVGRISLTRVLTE